MNHKDIRFDVQSRLPVTEKGGYFVAEIKNGERTMNGSGTKETMHRLGRQAAMGNQAVLIQIISKSPRTSRTRRMVIDGASVTVTCMDGHSAYALMTGRPDAFEILLDTIRRLSQYVREKRTLSEAKELFREWYAFPLDPDTFFDVYSKLYHRLKQAHPRRRFVPPDPFRQEMVTSVKGMTTEEYDVYIAHDANTRSDAMAIGQFHHDLMGALPGYYIPD